MKPLHTSLLSRKYHKHSLHYLQILRPTSTSESPLHPRIKGNNITVNPNRHYLATTIVPKGLSFMFFNTFWRRFLCYFAMYFEFALRPFITPLEQMVWTILNLPQRKTKLICKKRFEIRHILFYSWEEAGLTLDLN